MNEENTGSESKLFNVSIRGIAFIIVVIAICVMTGLGIEIKEPLYSIALVIVGAYFRIPKPSQS